MLAQDAFSWFETHGGLTRANGQRFRDLVLSRGNTEDYGAMYRSFTGHDPDIRPYLEYYGLPTTGSGPMTVTPVESPATAPVPTATPAPQKGERGR
jgi:peptidyl-dipeptidase Dcp